MNEDAARREARRAVDAHGGRGSFARRASVDPGTLTDFLDGVRWPQAKTRTKIERALGWTPGRLEDMREGAGVEPVQDTQGAALDVSGLSPTQRRAVELVIAAMKETHHDRPAKTEAGDTPPAAPDHQPLAHDLEAEIDQIDQEVQDAVRGKAPKTPSTDRRSRNRG